MENLVLEKNYFDEIYSKLISNSDEINNESKKGIDKSLFSSINVLNMTLKNNFVFVNYCDELFNKNGEINKSTFLFFKKIAKSGVSLICTGGIDVEKNIDKYTYRNKLVLKELIDDIHSSGTKIFLTLKTTRGRILRVKKSMFLTSSNIRREYYSVKKFCVPIFDSRCKKLASAFAESAKFAEETGFDGIVIDGSLSNLLGEMTSTEFNKRVFGYYSNIEDLPNKMMKYINKLSINLPILYKITPYSFFNDCFSLNKLLSLKGVKFEAKNDKIFNFFKFLVLKGIDGFLFEFGSYENQFLNQFSPLIGQNLYTEFYDFLEKFFIDNKLKNKFNDDILLICSDNFNDNFYGIKKTNRLFDITRNLYSDLNFLNNIYFNNKNKNCIRCGVCKKVSEEKNEVYCAINPKLKYGENCTTSDTNKKIAVVGSGVSGIVSALELAKRGFSIDIYEKESKLNIYGRLCEVFGKDIYLKNFNDYIENDLLAYVKQNRINLKKSLEFKVLDSRNYDVIVLATGFKELFLGVPGAVLKSVVSIFDVLMKKIKYDDKKHIVIYARSELSFKLALILAEQKHNVSLLLNKLDFINKMPQNLLSYYLLAASKLKIKIYVGCEIKNINEDSVELYINFKTSDLDYVTLISNIKSGKNYKFLPKAKVIDCHLFIYDPEIISNNKLFYEIVKSGYMGEIYMIGDALEVANLSDEIKSAYFVGNNI